MLEENVGNALKDRGKGKAVQNKPLDTQEIISLRYKTIESRFIAKRRSMVICENMPFTIHQCEFKSWSRQLVYLPDPTAGYVPDILEKVTQGCDCVLENLTGLRS